jgi:ferredoxin-NADP reductase
MHVQYYDAVVVDIKDETADVKRYFIKMPDEIKFEFKAGQFVMLDLPIEAKFTNRSYSIASAPTSDNIFELCIVLKPDGAGTPHLWEHVHVGSVVKTAGPYGKFVLPETIDVDICFIATGTGIAPLRSMLFHILSNQLPHQSIYMIFGNRYLKDVVYYNEMLDIQNQFPSFKFIPVLSRENETTWEGRQGYVHQVYQQLFENKRQALFYICGWKNMVREARENLKLMGYGKAEIKFESYD